MAAVEAREVRDVGIECLGVKVTALFALELIPHFAVIAHEEIGP